MKKMNCYGIDLGTTNSCVTIINSDGKPEIVKNANGQDLTPSVVCYPQGKDSVIVGQAAKNGRLFREKTTVSWIKREIGKEFGAQTPFPRNLTPVQISADILKKLHTSVFDLMVINGKFSNSTFAYNLEIYRYPNKFFEIKTLQDLPNSNFFQQQQH